MTDDTIDSEVVDILESLGNKILSHSDKMVWSVNRKREADVNAIEETEQIIKQLIAQEANKAKIEAAEQLRDKIYGFLHVLPLTMNDKEAILNIDYEFEEYIVQLTADKEEADG